MFVVLNKYDHPLPSKPQQAPNKHCEITYIVKQQLVPDNKTSPALDISGIRRVQDIIGEILYYEQVIDNKILVTLSKIGNQQAKATEATDTDINKLMGYVATYPNNGITYRASNMSLAAHSDAAYLNVSKARSRA